MHDLFQIGYVEDTREVNEVIIILKLQFVHLFSSYFVI